MCAPTSSGVSFTGLAMTPEKPGTSAIRFWVSWPIWWNAAMKLLLLREPRLREVLGGSESLDRPRLDHPGEDGDPSSGDRLREGGGWTTARCDGLDRFHGRAASGRVRVDGGRADPEDQPEGELVGSPVDELLLVIELLGRAEVRGPRPRSSHVLVREDWLKSRTSPKSTMTGSP